MKDRSHGASIVEAGRAIRVELWSCVMEVSSLITCDCFREMEEGSQAIHACYCKRIELEGRLVLTVEGGFFEGNWGGAREKS